MKKTKILYFDEYEQETIMVIDGEVIEKKKHFEYLGAKIEGDGRSRNEFRRRLAIANQKLTNMSKLWKGQNKNTKLSILISCIFPVALYGCEAWTPLTNDISII